MFQASHNRAYQDFLTLLTEFEHYLVQIDAQPEKTAVNRKFQQISRCFKEHIVKIDSQDVAPEILGRWQSVQTEIKREFQLLSVDILFLASARQLETRKQRIGKIRQHLSKLSDYCRIMLNDSEPQ
ncbi:MAG: heterocyst frequency control protein PatD [Cyanobacteria bacterium J06621_8]